MRLSVTCSPQIVQFRHVAGTCFSFPAPQLHRYIDKRDSARIVILREDDKVVDSYRDSVESVVEHGLGAFTYSDNEIFLTASDNSNPSENGRVYEIYVDARSRGAFSGQASSRPAMSCKTINRHAYIDMLADPVLSEFFADYQSRNTSPMKGLADSDNMAAIFLRITHMGSSAARNAVVKCAKHFDFGMKKDIQSAAAGYPREKTRDQDSPCRLYFSHSELPVHQLINRESKYFTILRDPIFALASRYHHNTSKALGIYQSESGRRYNDFDEWLDHLYYGERKDRPTVNNLPITRYMAHLGRKFPDVYAEYKRNTLKSFPRSGAGQLVRDVIDQLFFFIGVTEYFDESLFVLYLTLGISLLPMWAHDTRSAVSAKTVLTARQRMKIEEIVAPDVILYQEIRREFEEKYKIEIEFFRNHIKSLRGYMAWA